MKAATTVILLAALSLPAVMAGPPVVHTACYNYFLEKDHCVHGSPNFNDRCKPKSLETVPMLSIQGVKKRSENHSLERRYDTKHVGLARLTYTCDAPGGSPANYWDTQNAVCVWDGGSRSTGWLDWENKANCGKQVYVQRQGNSKSVVYAQVMGACDFGTPDSAVGCFNIGVNTKLFEALSPGPNERTSKAVGPITWDWNNPNGDKGQNGPQ